MCTPSYSRIIFLRIDHGTVLIGYSAVQTSISCRLRYSVSIHNRFGHRKHFTSDFTVNQSIDIQILPIDRIRPSQMEFRVKVSGIGIGITCQQRRSGVIQFYISVVVILEIIRIYITIRATLFQLHNESGSLGKIILFQPRTKFFYLVLVIGEIDSRRPRPIMVEIKTITYRSLDT